MRSGVCVKAVNSMWVRLGKVVSLSPVSTSLAEYLTSRVFLYPVLWTDFKQLGGLFTQLIAGDLDLFGRSFYTLPTGPMNTTNLIKDY